ncbi:MAG: Eco57I restriction-modification methylase domain-containing protein, partial [Candidatus Hodarchaeales archaeon]
MYSLYSSLKPFYEKFLNRGNSYGQSVDIVHEGALNLFIKILGLFIITITDEDNTEKIENARNIRMAIHEVIFQPENSNYHLFPKGIPVIFKDLLKLTHLEYQLKDSLTVEEWDELIKNLLEIKWVLSENFDDSKISDSNYTPGFLSYFYENVLNEFEDFFSLKPKVSKRKNKGIFYTGWNIVQKITKECLYQIEQQNLPDKDDNFLDLKILDPACGTGSFLVYAAELIFRYHKEQLENQDISPSDIIEKCIYGIDLTKSSLSVVKFRLLCWILSKDINQIEFLHSWTFMNIISGNSLFGLCKEKFQYPLDYYAVLSRIVNYIESNIDDSVRIRKESSKNWIITSIQTKEAKKGLFHSESLEKAIYGAENELQGLVDTFYHNILVRSIKSYPKNPPLRIKDLEKVRPFHWGIAFPEVILNGGFDIIIGNPPYGRSILSAFEKQLLKLVYKSCSGENSKKYSLNAVSAFIERSITLLKSNGILGFIVPFSILRVEEFETLRDLLLEKMVVLRIDDESAAFTDVTLEMCTIFLLKQKKEDYKVRITPRTNIIAGNEISINIFKNYKRFMIYHSDLWTKTENQGKQNVVSGDYGIDHRIVKKDLSREYSSKYSIIFLHSGRSVGKYALNPKHFHWSKPHPNNERFTYYFREKKIVNTAIGNRFRVAIKPEKIIPGTNVSIMEVPDSYQQFPMLILLNSDLINYLLKRYILNFSHLTVYLHKYYTKILPIKYPHDNEKEFEILASYLIFLNQCVLSKYLAPSKRGLYFDNLANYLVYDLYFPNILGSSYHFGKLVGKHLKPIEINTFQDLIIENFVDNESDTEMLDRLISENKRIIYQVANRLRGDQKIQQCK